MRITHSLVWLSISAGLLAVAILLPGLVSAAGSVPLPTPTYDPLATPVLPENPSPKELGATVYYHHCMPCHGDLGQGLTDAFRGVWEDEHQNCWGRGCHGGRSIDQGFPIPTVVPAVMAAEDALPGYKTPQQLFDYLESTHPPQEPGRLGEEDTWALVALLWEGNGKPAMQPTAIPATLSPTTTVTSMPVSATVASTSTPADPARATLSVCGVSLFFPVVVVFMAALGRTGKRLA
jgi:hypothetical protein